jgi:pyruvate dehydrogenase E2 component (dihydrolipoamide acetyltransferase)
MRKLTAALAFSLVALVACSESKPADTTTTAPAAPSAPAAPATPDTPPAPTPTAPAPAADPKAEAETKPRDYSDAAWQKSVDDAYLAKVIVEGGAAVGKSPLMVANADLKDKPAVVTELVAKVRSFGGGAAPAAPAPGGAAPAPTK